MTHFRSICDSNSNVRLKHINIVHCQGNRYWKFCTHSNENLYIKKNGRIFKFFILACTWNNNPLYYALPEIFINLFGAIKEDVYCSNLEKMCLLFIYDHPKYLFWCTNTVYFTILLHFYGGKILHFTLMFRKMFWILSCERKWLNARVCLKMLFLLLFILIFLVYKSLESLHNITKLL